MSVDGITALILALETIRQEGDERSREIADAALKLSVGTLAGEHEEVFDTTHEGGSNS